MDYTGACRGAIQKYMEKKRGSKMDTLILQGFIGLRFPKWGLLEIP